MIAPIAKELLLLGSLYTTFKLSRTFSKINGRSLTVASFFAKIEATCRATIRWCSYSTFSTPFQALSWALPPLRWRGRILAEGVRALMKCVHIDGNSSLMPHSDLTLMKLPPFEIPKAVLNWAGALLPGGLSFWGWKCIPYIYEIENGRFDPLDTNYCNCLIERDFEMIRRQDFPEMPSRLQCVFASTTISELLKDWAMLFNGKASFYEAFCSESYPMDAAFLNGYSAATEYRLTDSTPGVENIYKYWRCEKYSSPRMEILLPLQAGVHIGNNLTIRR